VYAQNANGFGQGTTSAAVTPSAPSKATTVQEPQLTYDTWQPQTLTGASGGTVRTTNTANSTASFVFTATGVTWLTRGGPTMGQAQVLIDGVSKGTVDLYRPTALALTQAYTGLKKVKHTLTIKALGTHNVSATDSVVAIDGFKVGTTVTQDSAVKVTYGGWSGVSNASANGKTLRLASTAGATARYTFTGTGIDWITAVGPAYGQAQVSIDGVVVGTYNLYAAAQQWKVTKAFSGLAAGSHQLIITVLGTKGTAAAKGTGVVVDAVVVHS
jgi:hypothetical protein